MYKLKVKKFNEVYCKKFDTVQEVFDHIQTVLFGYASKYADFYELQETKNALDIRFYVSYIKD